MERWCRFVRGGYLNSIVMHAHVTSTHLLRAFNPSLSIFSLRGVGGRIYKYHIKYTMAENNTGYSKNPLDMTLEDLISANKTNSSRQGPGRGRPPRGHRGGRRSQSTYAHRPINPRPKLPPSSNGGTQETTKPLLSHNPYTHLHLIDFIKFRSLV